MITTPKRMPLNTMPKMAMLAQIRQGRSRTWVSESDVCAMARSLMHPMDHRRRRRINHELGDRVAVCDQHQDKDKSVPESKAVERRRNAMRRMHRQCVKGPLNHRQRAAMKDGEIAHEQQGRG